MAITSLASFPSIDLSTMPKFPRPRIDVPSIDTEAVTARAKDAAYIAVGLGVLAVQGAQVRRREIAEVVTQRVDSSRAQIGEVVDAIEAGIAIVDARVRNLLADAG